MTRTRAVIFDLYGTLLRVGDQSISRGMPRVLGVHRRRWMDLVRGPLLTRPFEDAEAFVRFVCDSLAPGHGPEMEETCRALVERELASVAPIDGAAGVLAFLRRRGYALGVLSNLSSLHKQPFARLGWGEHFGATGFSCDLGAKKPEPRVYLDLLERLGARPGETVMVGDSLESDVEAPRALGLRAVRIAADGRGAGLPAVSLVGWLDFDRVNGEPVRLVADGDEVRLAGRTGVIEGFRPLSDAEQGRYNLVASARVAYRDGGRPESEDVFCKRFLFPEGIHVEELAHRLYAAVGAEACRAGVVGRGEPCLVVSRAPGRKFEGEVDPPLAYEVGRHCAVAFLFGNADLRPRNTFLDHDERGRPIMTMIDLEHCFFNLAIDPAGLEDPLRPEAIDRLPPDELRRRIKKRVLTDRTTLRTRKSFFDSESPHTERARAFRRGWIDLYRHVQSDADRLLALIEERVYQEPPLIIGTQSYRRAMAKVDLEDMRERIALDPEAAGGSAATFAPDGAPDPPGPTAGP